MIRDGSWSIWRSPMAISDIAVLADQEALFGPVASDATCWRLLEALDEAALAAIAAARARAREVAWAQRAEATGAAFGRPGGRHPGVEALVIDLDAPTTAAVRPRGEGEVTRGSDDHA
jgi:hypothetical protein